MAHTKGGDYMAKIEQMKSGKYRARVYVGKDADGKKHWKSITHEDKTTLKLIVSEYEYNRKVKYFVNKLRFQCWE